MARGALVAHVRAGLRALLVLLGLLAIAACNPGAIKESTPSSPTPGTPAPVASPATPATMVRDCGLAKPTTKPTTLTISCADGNDKAVDLQWTSWTATGATATGTETWNTCVPSCAASTQWDTTAASFTLSDPVQTAQGMLFAQLTVKDLGATPAGKQRTTTVNEAPSGS